MLGTITNDKQNELKTTTACIIYLQGDYMFRPTSLGHHQVISIYRRNYTIYDTTFEIKSLLFEQQ